MKADFTRLTFDPKKHYHGVRQQQGRVQLDSDWNEQVDLENYRTEIGTADIIGGCGGPLNGAGFKLSGGAIPSLSAGRYYVDGILAQNDQDGLKINAQPDFPGFNLVTTDGYYLAYLDVWERSITALEDPAIREVALGGPDTATRERTTWQARLLGPYGAFSCPDSVPDYDALLNPNPVPGQLAADAPEGSTNTELCDVPAVGGYRRLENQLYRVEIHQGGTGAGATFKWSRDNGSVVTAWLDQQGTDLVVSSIGRDKVLGFAPGQTVELIDDARELRGEKGTLVHISTAEGSSAGSVLTLDPSDPVSVTVNKTTQFPDNNALGLPNHPRVRRWDSDGELQVKVGVWIPLEDGIVVKFDGGAYHSGDYWLIPARSATGDVEWPRDNANKPVALEAAGIKHHYCKLAVLQHSAGTFNVLEDCRALFPPLTDLVTFQYLSGDGQETPLGGTLPQLLMVGVSMGKWPLGQGPLAGKKFKVRFEVLNNAGFVGTDVNNAKVSAVDHLLVDVINGIASCGWRPANDASLLSQQLRASLFLSNGTSPSGHLAIIFNANLSLASQVTYIPDGACTELSGVNNVQDALDTLCKVRAGVGCCHTVGDGGEFPTIIAALDTLLGKKETQICLCLLPGVHTSDGLALNLEGTPGVYLKIHGCAGSQVVLKGKWDLEYFTAITLEDLIFQIPDPGDVTPWIGLFHSGEVVVRGCQIAAEGGSGYLLGIQALTNVLIEENQMDAVVLSDTVVKAIATTPIADVVKIANLAQMNFSANTVTLTNLLATHATQRRAMMGVMVATATANKATLTAEQSAIINQVNAVFSAGRVDAVAAADAIDQIVQIARSPGRALFLIQSKARVAILNNAIYGHLSLYGPSGKVLWDPQELENWARQGLDIIKKGGLQFVTRLGSLLIQGNSLTTLTVADALVALLQDLLNGKSQVLQPLYQDAILQGNSFDFLGSLLLANHINCHQNVFRRAGVEMLSAAETGIYVGNRGGNSDSILFALNPEHQEAANLRLNIV